MNFKCGHNSSNYIQNVSIQHNSTWTQITAWLWWLMTVNHFRKCFVQIVNWSPKLKQEFSDDDSKPAHGKYILCSSFRKRDFLVEFYTEPKAEIHWNTGNNKVYYLCQDSCFFSTAFQLLVHPPHCLLWPWNIFVKIWNVFVKIWNIFVKIRNIFEKIWIIFCQHSCFFPTILQHLLHPPPLNESHICQNLKHISENRKSICQNMRGKFFFKIWNIFVKILNVFLNIFLSNFAAFALYEASTHPQPYLLWPWNMNTR